MPEQLTKHPEVTLQVLKSAGANCGAGATQEILTQCPSARFCKLPGGELCVYGLPEATQMTQVSAAEWRALVGAAPPANPAPPAAPPLHPGVAAASGVGLVLIGVAIGWVLRKRPR